MYEKHFVPDTLSDHYRLFLNQTALHLTGDSLYDIDTVLYQQILEDFPSRATAEDLISSFFFYAEANWYYFDERSFRKQLSELYDSGISLASSSPKFICLVISVFALGSQFVHLYHAGHSNNLEIMNAAQTEVPGTRYFQHAQKLVCQTIASPSLEGLLSCLILALYVLPIHSVETCYTYLGLALRIAICLGLHQKSSGSSISSSLSEVQNRVFWSTYTIERYEYPYSLDLQTFFDLKYSRVALSLGYPETLQIKDIDCLLPQRHPDLDSKDSFRAERLLAYTKLTLLLNKVINIRLGTHIHYMQERRKIQHGWHADSCSVLDKCSTEEIRSQLISWKADLPAQFTTLDGKFLRLNVHLQLHYSMTWIYIGRAALMDSVRTLLSNKEPTLGDFGDRQGSQELSDSCAEHAARIVDLIGLLRSRGQLALFSHTDFHTCSSATIIVLLDSILNPRLTSFPKVKTAMDALRYMATGSALAKSSLKYVENFQGVVNTALASMHCKSRESPRSLEELGLLEHGESQPGTDTEGWDMSSHQNECQGQGPNMALLYDIEAMLEDCPFTELHLLGLDGLYASDVLD